MLKPHPDSAATALDVKLKYGSTYVLSKEIKSISVFPLCIQLCQAVVALNLLKGDANPPELSRRRQKNKAASQLSSSQNFLPQITKTQSHDVLEVVRLDLEDLVNRET